MKSLRLYHLIFALALVTAYLTAEELGIVHAWTGYAMAALLLLRLLLGMARARGFEMRRLVPRLSTPPAGQRGIRHPAIAHWLTLALLVCAAGAATTGIAMDRGGTLAGDSIRSEAREKEREAGEHGHDDEGEDLSSLLDPIPSARASEADGEGEADEALEEVHETFGNLLLPLALAHILYMLLFRFELARFMLFVNRRRSARA